MAIPIIHKEGTRFITVFGVLFIISVIAAIIVGATYSLIIAGAMFALFAFIARFFRCPKRPLKQIPGTVLSPCDGKVVIVEEVEEPEYFKDRRLQISVFMSPNNVHVNWVPFGGKVDYFRYHKGKYLVAFHPKSSILNERTTCVVNDGKRSVLFRQIAGCVARRVVYYVEEGDSVEQNQQAGFIKFGSRMDLFLPLGTEICVKQGDKVTGTETILAKFE